MVVAVGVGCVVAVSGLVAAKRYIDIQHPNASIYSILSMHPKVSSMSISTLIGITCIIYMLLFGVIFGLITFFLGSDTQRIFPAALVAALIVNMGFILRKA